MYPSFSALSVELQGESRSSRRRGDRPDSYDWVPLMQACVFEIGSLGYRPPAPEALLPANPVPCLSDYMCHFRYIGLPISAPRCSEIGRVHRDGCACKGVHCPCKSNSAAVHACKGESHKALSVVQLGVWIVFGGSPDKLRRKRADF